jgi:hypothetical protein
MYELDQIAGHFWTWYPVLYYLTFAVTLTSHGMLTVQLVVSATWWSCVLYFEKATRDCE